LRADHSSSGQSNESEKKKSTKWKVEHPGILGDETAALYQAEIHGSRAVKHKDTSEPTQVSARL
jgi:hypothetical protein